jgi:hypothetical protein
MFTVIGFEFWQIFSLELSADIEMKKVKNPVTRSENIAVPFVLIQAVGR